MVTWHEMICDCDCDDEIRLPRGVKIRRPRPRCGMYLLNYIMDVTSGDPATAII